MADEVITRFIFEFVSNTQALMDGNEKAKKSSDALAKVIESLSLKADSLATAFKKVADAQSKMGISTDKISKTNTKLSQSIDKVTKSTKDATKSTKDSNILGDKSSLSLEKHTMNMNKLGKSVNSVVKSFKGLSAEGIGGLLGRFGILGGIAAAAAGTYNFFVPEAGQNIGAVRRSQISGLGANQLQRYKNLADVMGTNPDELINQMDTMAVQNYANIMFGQVTPFALAAQGLGIKRVTAGGKPVSEDKLFENTVKAYQRYFKVHDISSETGRRTVFETLGRGLGGETMLRAIGKTKFKGQLTYEEAQKQALDTGRSVTDKDIVSSNRLFNLTQTRILLLGKSNEVFASNADAIKSLTTEIKNLTTNISIGIKAGVKNAPPFTQQLAPATNIGAAFSNYNLFGGQTIPSSTSNTTSATQHNTDNSTHNYHISSSDPRATADEIRNKQDENNFGWITAVSNMLGFHSR